MFSLVGIGIAPPNYPTNQFPGLQKESFGYHGDDGNIFTGSGKVSFTRAKFGVNDTIGCGISPSGQVFFTKNGFFLGKILFRCSDSFQRTTTQDSFCLIWC
jgi:hypothetical protein